VPVFKNLADAVSALTAIAGPPPAVTQAVADLVAVGRRLVVLAIEPAATEGGRAREISRAQEELAQGDRARDLGNFAAAIDEYRKAWQRAR
jgi:hypothetical protein